MSDKLTRHPKGWVKKINGRTRWICSLAEAATMEAALVIYRQRAAELHGDVPPADVTPAANLFDLMQLYRTRARFKALADKSRGEITDALQLLADCAGDINYSDLAPAHFAAFRAKLDERFGVARTSKFIIICRGFFKWCGQPPLRLPLPDYGEAMTVPSRRDFRLERKASRDAHGDPLFTPAEIRIQLKNAKPKMRAMILLAINAALGNTDLATIPVAVADRACRTGWLDYARQKTGAERRARLWVPTIAAVRAVIGKRTEGVLFVTKFGKPFIGGTKDQISIRYAAFLKSKKIRQARPGRGFYSLRRTFRTWASDMLDEPAVDRVMGHAPRADDMAAVYTVQISDARLKRVSDHVFRRLALRADASPARARRATR